MKVNFCGLKLLVAVLVFAITPTQTNGLEKEARVKHVTAATSDGILFAAWVMRQNINSGQPIVIYYRVENHSRTPIYLVRDNTSKTVIKDDSIVFPTPYVPLGGHEEYNYSFTKIARGRSYHGKLHVSGDEYKEAQSWSVNVGFGYVTKITGLNALPDQTTDPAPFKSLLNTRIQTLLLSSLRIEIMEK